MQIDAIFGAIGGFAVRFRWLVLVAWIVAAIAAATQLPSLASVTQSNNSKFLPASAPSSHAADLATPFGIANKVPVPVLAARPSARLTTADVTALTALQGKLRSVSGVTKVLDAGRSPDGHAEQLVVLAQLAGGNQNAAEDLVNAVRSTIARAGLPAGLQVHLAGDIAAQVDQQKASGNTGNRVQAVSLVFILALLVLIFRSFTLAITTVIPAVLSVTIAGPLVAEAAHHGHRLRAVPGLPGPRGVAFRAARRGGGQVPWLARPGR
jgi:putative drug exporter of the RND superfamily